MWTARRELYSSKTASEITSETYWVGDARTISVFVRGTNSVTTLQGSDADGRDAAIAEASWSNLTAVSAPAPNMIDIAPGFGWFRGIRSLTTELTIQVQNIGTYV